MLIIKKTLWICAALLLAGNAMAFKFPGRRAQETGDDGFDICNAEQEAGEKCFEANSCQACEDLMGDEEQPAEPSFFGEDMGEGDMTPADMENLDFSSLVPQINTWLDQTCTVFKDGKCKMMKCCDKCTNEIEAFYTCMGKNMGGEFTADFSEGLAALGALANMTALAGGEPGATPPPAPPADMSEIKFDCDLAAVKCEDGASAGGSGAHSLGMMAASFLGMALILKNF